jgi:hypothetical protein
MKLRRKNHTIRRNKAIPAVLIILIALFNAPTVSAAPGKVTVEGVDFKREVRVNDATLALRGYGLLRYMVFIKAYVAAFYLPESRRSEDALDNVPKHLEIEYFHDINVQDFAKATTSSISRNLSLMTFQRLKPKIDEFNALYRDVKAGDRYALTYVPGKGTTLLWNGRPLGTVADEDFAVGLFGIWIGANPLDSNLKRLLLGE